MRAQPRGVVMAATASLMLTGDGNPSGGSGEMGRNRSAIGLVVTTLALAMVPAVLLSAGVSRAAASTCGSLSRGSGAPTGGGELSNTAFVSAGESWAVGDLTSQGTANRTLIERFNGSAWSVVSSPNQGRSEEHTSELQSQFHL